MLVERFGNNPIIRPGDVKPSRDDYQVVCAFNPGVIKFNGQYLLLLRVAEVPLDKKDDEQVAPIFNHQTGELEHFRLRNDTDGIEIPDSRSFSYQGQMYLTSISHLRIARSDDGKNFVIDPEPAVFPETDYEAFGLEDPRITQIGDTYYITYKPVSYNAICTALITTKDFVNFERKGIIFCAENLDVMLFPEKINGKYYALHRPVPKYLGRPSIWIASSSNLTEWGDHKIVVPPRSNTSYWDCQKTGGSCVPIRTDKGWLEIYHATDENYRYALGAVLFDLDDPSKVIARASEPLMVPETDYEMTGFFGNVVFSCGCVVEDDGRVLIYYGAADEYTAGAETTLDKIMGTLE